VTITFSNGRHFILLGFVKSDLREIANRVRAANPGAIDSLLDQFLATPAKPARRWHDSFRPGDAWLALGALAIVLLTLLWSVLERSGFS
jgi:hypothetical protein